MLIGDIIKSYTSKTTELNPLKHIYHFPMLITENVLGFYFFTFLPNELKWPSPLKIFLALAIVTALHSNEQI